MLKPSKLSAAKTFPTMFKDSGTERGGRSFCLPLVNGILLAMSDFSFRPAPEKTIFIDLPDTEGLKIKGILRGSFDQPLAVLIHGLPGSGNGPMQYLAAHHLSEHGIASLRLFLYDDDPNTRDLADCTLDVHASDFGTAVDYLRAQDVKQLFAVGHSYGGLTLLRSQASLDGAVLWDPTHGEVFSSPLGKKWEKEARVQSVDGFKLYLDGKGYIEPEAIMNEQATMGDTSDWAKKDYPLKIITAGQGMLVEFGAKYAQAAQEPKVHVIIPGASHNFMNSDEDLLKLFDETYDWIKEFTNV
ncbi:MAG: hypothetical protein JWN82_336 [Candidatus Saccharibacteria bacterium]|nr:hypothetical protein [Candidatus Saccharibacteria bacterium]